MKKIKHLIILFPACLLEFFIDGSFETTKKVTFKVVELQTRGRSNSLPIAIATHEQKTNSAGRLMTEEEINKIMNEYIKTYKESIGLECTGQKKTASSNFTTESPFFSMDDE